MDGTLIHFKIDFMKARSAAIKILKKYGVPRKILSLKSSILDSVKIAKEILTNNGLNPQDIQEVMKKVNEKGKIPGIMIIR